MAKVDESVGQRRRWLRWEWVVAAAAAGGIAALAVLAPLERYAFDLARWLPFGYAFGAGMLTAVSPCGVIMLPAYASLYVGSGEDSRPRRRRVGRALLMSAVVTGGFIVLFGVIGVVFSWGGSFLRGYVPWVAVAIGLLLMVLGVYMVAGGKLYSSLPARLASRLGGATAPSVRGFFVFGVAYAIAALSCTMPVFLLVVSSAVTTGGFLSGVLQFASFSLGMGLVILVVTVGLVLFRETVNRWLHRAVPVVARYSGLLLVIAGGYIIYYWFAVVKILSRGI